MAKEISFRYKSKGGITIGEFLENQGYSDNNAYYLLNEGRVFVNGNKITSKNYKLDEEIKNNILVMLLEEKCSVIPTNKPINIVYEDDYLLIVNKDYNVDVEPTMANNEDSLANYVANYYKEKNIASNIHLVNRLDKLTTGIVILAKNQYIHHLMSDVKIVKKYKALVEGKVKKGTIKVSIKKDENSIKRIVDPSGDPCITKYKLKEKQGDNSLVDIELITGRTHQIRVSFAYINHPLVGDPLYNLNYKENDRMALQAYKIEFIHPITSKKIKIEI